MAATGKSIKDYFKDVSGILNTPLHIPEFLLTPIPMPSFGGRKRKRRPSSKKGQKAQNQTSPASARNFILEGVLERGMNAKFSVAETDFEIDSNTWIVGSIEYGAHVKIKGLLSPDGRLATQVIVLRKP